MNILFTGRGTAGSWKIRGEQLASAMGAKAIPNASDEDIEAADVVVMVKKPGKANYSKAKLLVWDIVDCWPQPEGNNWPLTKAVDHVKSFFCPDAFVYATEQMASDLSINKPGLCLPHHYRPGIKRNEIRSNVKTVGYEGDEKYLGEWRNVLEYECNARGWKLCINPESLSDLDIVVALRGGKYRGTITTRWKSNVKLANSQGSGTPIVCNRESGYMETSAGRGVCFADTHEELHQSFNLLSRYEVRRSAQRYLLDDAMSLEQIAGIYKEWLLSLKS